MRPDAPHGPAVKLAEEHAQQLVKSSVRSPVVGIDAGRHAGRVAYLCLRSLIDGTIFGR
ncbi:MAG: hypothetical protein OXN89_12365 [Bryobacterales bacterium]|nr:hypothetical protein [Bryobacterales bacterium]